MVGHRAHVMKPKSEGCRRQFHVSSGAKPSNNPCIKRRARPQGEELGVAFVFLFLFSHYTSPSGGEKRREAKGKRDPKLHISSHLFLDLFCPTGTNYNEEVKTGKDGRQGREEMCASVQRLSMVVNLCWIASAQLISTKDLNDQW